MQTAYSLFVGIDWAYEAHQVCALDGHGALARPQFSAEHSGPALARMADTLVALAGGDPEAIAVAIEVPRGPVVETLLDRGIAVFTIHPKQLDRFRDRHTSAGAKDDRLDAFVAADAARTDLAKLRRVRLDAPALITLRELSRLEASMAADLSRHANRVRDQLVRYFPQVLRFCPTCDEPWLWDLLERAPTPERAARLHEKTIERILKLHRIRRVSAAQLSAACREQPLVVAPGVAEAAAEHIRLVLPLLRAAHTQLTRVRQRVGQLVDEACEPSAEHEGQHRDAAILVSLPGVGRVVAATMLAEASQAIAERDLERLRTETGVAPVTRRSGKSIVRQMRRACNTRLRRAVYFWAYSAMASDEVWKSRYAAMRARGHGHARALRSLADALLRVLIAMLRDGTLYDQTRPQRRAPRAPLPPPAAEAVAELHA
jgi:transposase